MLTREEIEKMPAGSELDRLVAELVLGWRKISLGELRPGHTRYPDKVVWDTLKGPYGDRDIEDFTPSVWLDKGWSVVNAMAKKGFWLKLQTPFCIGQPYFAAFDQHGVTDSRPPWEASGETAALAICKSALLVMQAAAPSPSPLPPTEKEPA